MLSSVYSSKSVQQYKYYYVAGGPYVYTACYVPLRYHPLIPQKPRLLFAGRC